jgi:hypothetical protein
MFLCDKNKNKDKRDGSGDYKNFSWKNFDMDKFFSDTDRAGEIIERKNSEKDTEENGRR